MRVIYSVHPDDFKTYNTSLIRERFLIDELMRPDKIGFVYTHYDRVMVGGAMPLSSTLTLENYANLRAGYFLERREIGIINVAGEAVVTVDDDKYSLQKLDCLYVGKGKKEVSFASKDPADPAVLYMLTSPAHAVYPVSMMKGSESDSSSLGSLETSNERTIYRYIHENGIQSCQLVMGLTILKKGSVWNTMPAHVHDRRMEAYFYFDLPEDQAIFHFMGKPDETRHILVKNYEAVVSPPWSIHAGSGTGNYAFIWGMAGENLVYSDMDPVAIKALR